MTEARVFKALGDPLRLSIVQRLSSESHHTISTLSADLGLTRQGARRQIQVLVDARILRLTPVGREVRVTLDASTLDTARAFIARLEQQWDQRLQALKTLTNAEDAPGSGAYDGPEKNPRNCYCRTTDL